MAVRLVAASRPVLPLCHDCTQYRHETSARAMHAVSHARAGGMGVQAVVREGEAHGRGRSVVAWRAQAASGTQSRPAVETVGFNDGSSTRFAPLINGCWTLAGGHGRILESEIVQVMDMYARSGLTSFDTADIYGPSESILGGFREKWLQEKQQNDGSRDVQAWHLVNPLFIGCWVHWISVGNCPYKLHVHSYYNYI